MKIKLVLVLFVALALGFLVIVRTTNKQELNIGILDDTLLSSLFFIAEEQDLFNKHGIKVILKRYNSGNEALGDASSGKIIVAAVPLATAVYNFLGKSDFCIVASLASSDNSGRILVRKDSGIINPQDLRDKKIATEQGSSAHFFLTNFLTRHNLSLNDIKLSFVPLETLPELLTSAEIDAFSGRSLLTRKTATSLEDKTLRFSAPGLVETRFILVVSNTFMGGESLKIEKVLAALFEAETFIKNYPQRALAIASNKLDLSESYIFDLWQYNEFELQLDKHLIDLMEERVKWALTYGVSAKDNTADIKNSFCAEPLKKIKPKAVEIQ